MQYKEGWEQSKKRFEAFWNGEIVDRCCISVKASDKAVLEQATHIPETDEERTAFWTDPEWIIRRHRNLMAHTYYGGDAFPSIFVNLGAGGHAGFFKGAKYYFGESVWFFPALSDLEQVTFDESSFLYRKTLELAKAFAEDSRGDYMVSMPDTSGNIDALAHLLGSDELMLSMLDDPDAVQAALKKVETVYERILREVYAIVRDVNEGGGCIDWMSTWAPGFHAQMQSDMSVMISNSMYKAFIVPELTAQSRFLDYPIYHLDGVEQIRHLDDLLAIPELKAIQWTQVAGQKPCTEYFPELRRIQEAGKNVIILVSPEQVQPIMENLSSKGLFLSTRVDTREEAEDLVKKVGQWTHE